MRQIRIYGCKNNQSLKKDISFASNLFLNILLPRKRKINITIKSNKDLIKTNSTYGECWQLDTPHSFLVVIDSSLSRIQFLKTLAHEFVHIKQFSLNELKFGSYCDIWNGVKYHHTEKYNTLPWEKEASILENSLYSEFKRHKKMST